MAASASTDGGDFVILDHLRGHKGQVLCVAVPEPAVRSYADVHRFIFLFLTGAGFVNIGNESMLLP